MVVSLTIYIYKVVNVRVCVCAHKMCLSGDNSKSISASAKIRTYSESAHQTVGATEVLRF